jgi:hypothetical protein
MANAFQHSAFQVNAFQEALDNGTLYAIDQNDTGSFAGTVSQAILIHDGDGWKRRKAINKKLAELEKLRMKAMRDDAARRKELISDLVDPKPKVSKRKQKELQSNQELEVDIPSIDLAELDRSIAQLEKQKQDIAKAIAYKEEAARLEAAIQEAHRLAELDDEEALLALLF